MLWRHWQLISMKAANIWRFINRKRTHRAQKKREDEQGQHSCRIVTVNLRGKSGNLAFLLGLPDSYDFSCGFIQMHIIKLQNRIIV